MNLFGRIFSTTKKPPAIDGWQAFGPGDFPRENRMALVRRFGDQSLSYSSALQDGLRYFGSDDGYIAYQFKYGYPFALGDPVVHPSQREALMSAFVTTFRKASFCQINHETAEILAEKKFWINQMGIDTKLSLDSYDFAGKEKERFRYAANWLLRRDFEVVELPMTEAVEKSVQELVEQWRQTRAVKEETAFINRPLVYEDQPDVRRFFLRTGTGEIVAFVFFDPLYDDGQVVGYVTTFKRRHPNAPSMAEVGICKIAIETFRQEQRQLVRLGLSPLAALDGEPFRHNGILRRSFRYGFGAGWVNRYFYNLKGHAEFKSRFRGVESKCFFATPTYVNDLRLISLLRLCKII